MLGFLKCLFCTHEWENGLNQDACLIVECRKCDKVKRIAERIKAHGTPLNMHYWWVEYHHKDLKRIINLSSFDRIIIFYEALK